MKEFDALRIVIEGDPVPWGRPRVFKHQRTGKMVAMNPPKTQAWEDRAKLLALVAARQRRWDPKRFDAFDVEVWVARASRRGDADNFLKACLDSLMPHVLVDDRTVKRASVTIIDDDPKPRTVILVRPILMPDAWGMGA